MGILEMVLVAAPSSKLTWLGAPTQFVSAPSLPPSLPPSHSFVPNHSELCFHLCSFHLPAHLQLQQLHDSPSPASTPAMASSSYAIQQGEDQVCLFSQSFKLLMFSVLWNFGPCSELGLCGFRWQRGIEDGDSCFGEACPRYF